VCRQTLEGHASTVWSVRVHKESKRLVSVSDDCLVKVWGKEGSIYKPIQTVEGLHTREIYTCDFNIQQNLIATGSADNKIIISKFTDGLVGEVVITQVNNVKM
jgi:WD40 repeat protein